MLVIAALALPAIGCVQGHELVCVCLYVMFTLLHSRQLATAAANHAYPAR